MRAIAKARLYRELAKLIDADFHLDRSLDLLLKQGQPAAVQKLLHRWRDGMRTGQGIGDALTAAGNGVLDRVDLAMVAAGERSGKLGQSFRLLHVFHDQMATSVRQARRAMVYPLLLVHMAVVLPEIPSLIHATDPMAGALRIGGMLGVGWVLLFGLGWVGRMLSRRAATSPFLDQMFSLIPWLGKARKEWALARFTQVAHSGMLAAMRPDDWVRLAGISSGSGRLYVGADRAAKRVSQGQPVGESLRWGGGFPGEFVNAIDTAEQSGSLDHELERWTVLQREQASEATSRAAEGLPRIFYGLIVVYVVWRIFGMFQSIYEPVWKILRED